MNKINHIEKAIQYLQSLKEQNAEINHIEIDYGWRFATPEDENYCEWAETKTLDGSFFMKIKGRVLK